ncbi:MAG: molybdenum cofactor biosynthesis protein MoaE, partial [Thermoproteota archaeon]|nr:molybdenum cofactor biosynthesis protein MoaE [Thermoproteota archaeon]
AIFVGVVRGETREGAKVQKLSLKANEKKVNEDLAEICEELKKREGVVDVQIHPLLGEFNVGEDLLYVLVAGGHRKDVFSMLKEAVEQYNRVTFIFKKEYVLNKEDVAKFH